MTAQQLPQQALAAMVDLVQAAVPDLDICLIITDRMDQEYQIRSVSQIPPQKLLSVYRQAAERLEKRIYPEIQLNDDKVEYSMECHVKTIMEHKHGATGSRIKEVRILCPFPKAIQPPLKDEDGMLTARGLEISTTILVHALASNIHQGHQHKQVDSAAHLRRIIAMLEKLFVAQVEATEDAKWEGLG